MFTNQRDSILGLLILRHLHDGEAINWPAPNHLPQAPIFHTLEQHGYIARWDRIWPLSDRYRLTEKGAQALQSVYRPGSGEAVIKQLRARNLGPSARQQALRAMGFDPAIWCILHDPKTHWMTWPEQIGPYQRYIWEPEQGHAPAPGPRPAAAPGQKPGGQKPGQKPGGQKPGGQKPGAGGPRPGGGGPRPGGGARPSPTTPTHHHHHHHHDPGYVVGYEPPYGGYDPGYGGGYDPSQGGDTSYQGGGGESGGGGSSGGWDTDNLDQGGTGSSSEGGSYGDVS